MYSKDSNLTAHKIITWINEPKALTKHRSSEYKCKFDWTKFNLDQWWDKDKCWCECKKRYVCENDYVWNPSTCYCENGKYLTSIMDNSAIICDEVIEAYE